MTSAKRSSTSHPSKIFTRALVFALAFGFGLPVLAEEKPAETKPKRPNIVFVMADDLGWQDVGFLGSRYFETPHLDALAAESLVFQNAFMYPTCSASRAALLTGRQSFRTGSYCVPVLEKGKAADNIFSRWTVGHEHPVYAEPLSKAGYRLIHLGKWHIVGPYPDREGAILASGKKLGQPKNGDLSWLPAHRSDPIKTYYPTGRGFHENVGGLWWGDPARGYAEGYNAPGGGYMAPFKNPFIKENVDGEWLTDRLTDEAIAFIEENQAEPFFLNLHYYAPHRPSVARSDEALAHFQKKEGDPETGQGIGKNKEIAAYATMVLSLDDNIGRLLRALDERGLRENTVFVFTSDNGFNGLQSVNKRLRGAKGNVYDGGLRVPLLINWPGTVAARRETTPAHGIDLFPTFLEFAKVDDYSAALDGQSLAPMVRGVVAKKRRPLFWHIASRYRDPPCSIIRDGDWKLIQFLLDGKVELYNTASDLAEASDLAKSEPEVRERLLGELLAWRERHEVPLPPSSVLEK